MPGKRFRTPDTRIMIEGRQGSPNSEGGSQASQRDLIFPRSREFGAVGYTTTAVEEASEAIITVS
jgi:hypothetical protein